MTRNPEYLDDPAAVDPADVPHRVRILGARRPRNPVRELNMDLARLLHGGQEFVVPRPPAARRRRAHDRRSWIDEIYEKEGKRGGTMRFVEMVTEFRDESGKLVAEARDHDDRDRQGADGGMRDGVTWDDLAEGERAGAAREYGPLTRTDFVRYQGASGDFNPIHHDEEFAQVGRLPVGVLGRHAAGRHPRQLRHRLARREQRAPLRGAVPRAGVAGRHRRVLGHGHRVEYEDAGERKVDVELLCTRVESGGAAIKGEATFVVP